MAVASDSIPTPTRPLLPFVFRPSAPVDDTRTAVDLLDEIRRTIEAQEGVSKSGNTLELSPLLPAGRAFGAECKTAPNDFSGLDVRHGGAGCGDMPTGPVPTNDTPSLPEFGDRKSVDHARTLHLRREVERQEIEAAPLLPPAPLPSLTTALARRRVIFGAVALAAVPVAALPAMAGSSRQFGELILPVAVDPDADLIEFAGRVAALERRCYAFSEQRSTITDQVTSTLGFGPKAPPKPPSVSGVEKIEDYETATHRVMSISYALVEDPTVAEWEASHKAARATYKSKCKALEERLGLPELDRNFDRNWRRLHRWYAQLADMHPQTLAGLAAKAEPLVMISKASSCAGSLGEVDDYAHDLALSLAHDAMRLGRGGAHV